MLVIICVGWTVVHFIKVMLLVKLITNYSPGRPIPIHVNCIRASIPSDDRYIRVANTFRNQPCRLQVTCSRGKGIDCGVLGRAPYFVRSAILHLRVTIRPIRGRATHFALGISSLRVAGRVRLRSVLRYVLLRACPSHPFSASSAVPLASCADNTLHRVLMSKGLLRNNDCYSMQGTGLSPRR